MSDGGGAVMTWYAVTTTENPDEAEEAARERIALAWAAAPMDNLEVLALLLNTARQQVTAYAPAKALATEPLPDNLVLAQLMQAKNLWAAGESSSDGDIGEGGYTFQPRPLDKTVRTTIRPIHGRPHAL